MLLSLDVVKPVEARSKVLGAAELAKTHVAFVINNYPPKLGGLENHVRSLARHLVELGITVTVFSLDNENLGEQVESGVTVVRFRERFQIGGVLGFPTFGTKKRLLRDLRTRGVTHISTQTRFFPMSFIGARLAKIMQIPHIHTEHGSGHVVHQSALVRVMSRLVDYTSGRTALRSADTVLAVSEEVATFVRQLSGREAVVFYNAIELTPKPKEFGTAKTRTRLVFVGRIVEGKGWQVVYRLACKLRSQPRFENLEVVFIGSGNQSDELNQIALAPENTTWVRVLGQLPQAEVLAWLEQSVYLNPTLLAEGFQTTLLEAVSSGARVVTSQVPGAQKLKDQGAPIWIVTSNEEVDWENAVEEALTQEIQPFNQDELARWSWAERSKEFIAVLHSQAGGSRGREPIATLENSLGVPNV